MKKNPARHKMSTEDLLRLRIITGLAISPDENRVAFCVERMDKEANKYFKNIFMLDVSSRTTTQFTHGDQGDGCPVWSPDGSRLAFVSTRDKKTGLFVMPAGGGSEKKLLEVEGTLTSLRWTPDNRHLVFALRYSDAHFISDEKKKEEPPVYRHITRLLYRMDGEGFLPRDRFQVYALDVETAELRQITSGKRDNHAPVVSPDGRWIAYVSNRSKNPDVDSLLDDLFVIPFRGGRERRIPTPAGPIGGPKFSPDGKRIAYVGHANPKDAWGVTNLHVWVVGLSGSPAAHDLMPTFDRMAIEQSINDTCDAHDEAHLEWSADGRRIFFACGDTGTVNLFSVPSRGGRPTRLYQGKCHIRSFSINGATRKAAIVLADLHNPGEIVTCPLTYGAEKRGVRHTDLNPYLTTEVEPSRMREVWFKSADGTDVQGWLVLPPKFNPKRKYPAILEIHGGPRTQYVFTFFHEMQYLAACGYVVFYTNPRGGAGRGETWADAIAGGWGDLDYQDCMAAADWLAAQKFVDTRRMGVTGGSYGGYMTNWIIGHTHRFKAAITGRSVVELKSFYGSSDIGYELDREFDGHPWTNPENYEKCSPLTYFRNVKTPVLIMHQERDLRCNIEQAEQMFTMLKMLGKTVEMVRFPDESHGLSRHGRPDRRVARLEWMKKWFDRYLKKKW